METLTTDSFISKLRPFFDDVFPGVDVHLESLVPGRIGGYLIWEGFDGVHFRERQKRIWKVLRQHLSVNEQERITAILALTPNENNTFQRAKDKVAS